MNILVVEDDEFNQIVISDFIKIIYENSNIEVANDGLEALQILDNKEFNLILSDINMPNLDGCKMIKKIRESKNNIKAISVTAFSVVGDKERILQCGFNGYISKPIEFEELLKEVQRVMQ